MLALALLEFGGVGGGASRDDVTEAGQVSELPVDPRGQAVLDAVEANLESQEFLTAGGGQCVRVL